MSAVDGKPNGCSVPLSDFDITTKGWNDVPAADVQAERIPKSLFLSTTEASSKEKCLTFMQSLVRPSCKCGKSTGVWARSNRRHPDRHAYCRSGGRQNVRIDERRWSRSFDFPVTFALCRCLAQPTI